MRDEFRRDDVLRALRSAPGRRLGFDELADECAVTRAQRPRFRRWLKTLLKDGSLQVAKGRGYRLGRDTTDEDVAIEGVVRRHRHGFGFLVREDDEDLFLPAREIPDVLDGDTVRAIAVPGRFGRLAGRVLAVVKRGRQSVTGSYRTEGAHEFVLPDPEIWDGEIELVPGAVTPRPGEIVEVELRDWPDGHRAAVGRIVAILGAPGELGTLVATVIHRHGLARRFPDDVLEQAESLPAEIPPDTLAGREDLRGVPTFTIDGADARDFDDAVSIEPRPDSGVRLRVSIADVSHWVTTDSPLDREAFERGTSVYFPDRVIPMLPEKLSNGLASLRPGEDRLTLTAEMDFDRDGRRTRTRLYESVIRSHGRWTYEAVARVLAGEEVEGISEWRPQVVLFHRLMESLRARRQERGSLDFDLPEPEIVFDAEGEPDDVVRAERNDAHRMIEEMMIAANEAVADWFVEKNAPTIFRVHAPPDPVKLRDFTEFARAWGQLPEFGGLATSGALARFLRTVRGTPAERALHHILLRTMMRAEYAEENTGHYGLASERYLHFTSPIRRYPDLIVHRLAKSILGREGRRADRGALRRIAYQSSQREQAASQCEYDVLDVMRAYLLRDRIGDEFEGVISGINEDGFFVELLDHYVEGRVRLDDLDDDYYRFLPDVRVLLGKRLKKRYGIGDPVRVVVQAVHPAIGQIELRPADGRRADRPRDGRGEREPRSARGSSRRGGAAGAGRKRSGSDGGAGRGSSGSAGGGGRGRPGSAAGRGPAAGRKARKKTGKGAKRRRGR
ncbi:MAG: ribonuclease R [Gemmatimonadetes bacterium]|nr:ribonuclease R [Gemmatimonadota bacterium]